MSRRYCSAPDCANRPSQGTLCVPCAARIAREKEQRQRQRTCQRCGKPLTKVQKGHCSRACWLAVRPETTRPVVSVASSIYAARCRLLPNQGRDLPAEQKDALMAECQQKAVCL